MSTDENETENNVTGQLEAEGEEEFVINQIHGLFHFIQTNGSIKRFTERAKSKQKIDQSQHGTHKGEPNKNTHLLEVSTPSNGANLNSSNKLSNFIQPTSEANMDKVNGIDMHFTYRLYTEKKKEN